MDTGKPDGDSSSPNDKTIIAVRLEGAAGEVVRVDLSDGSSFFLPASTADSEPFAEGHTLDEEQFERLELLAEAFEAYRKGVSLLAVREQSRARLDLKLRSRGFSGLAIQMALVRLEEVGALDDLRFSRLWISGRKRRSPCGRVKLYAGLLERGVSRSVVEEALLDWTEEDEEESLRRAAERALARRNTSPERALRALVSKGFSLTAARRALARIESEPAD